MVAARHDTPSDDEGDSKKPPAPPRRGAEIVGMDDEQELNPSDDIAHHAGKRETELRKALLRRLDEPEVKAEPRSRSPKDRRRRSRSGSPRRRRSRSGDRKRGHDGERRRRGSRSPERRRGDSRERDRGRDRDRLCSASHRAFRVSERRASHCFFTASSMRPSRICGTTQQQVSCFARFTAAQKTTDFFAAP